MFDWYLFYTVLSIVFMSLMVLFSIVMIIIVVMQQGNNANLGANSRRRGIVLARIKQSRWTPSSKDGR